MKPHIKNYIKHYNIGEQDWVGCEVCNAQSVDIHHIKLKSAGGTDEVDNLIALCRNCHLKAHFQQKPYLSEEDLIKAKETL